MPVGYKHIRSERTKVNSAIQHYPVLATGKLWPLWIVLYGSMATLLFFALYYYKLRAGFSDTSAYLINITRNDGFYIAHNRFVSVLNQWLPVLFLKMHASLNAIAITYSLGYSLVPVILALLCMHWLKRPYHALAIMLLVSLMNMLLFYYSVSELQSGLCLLLFYDAILDQLRSRKAYVVSTLIIVPTVAFSHPMCLPVFIGWLAYRIIIEQPRYSSIAGATACFFAACAVKKIWFASTYESAKMLRWQSFRGLSWKHYSGPFAQSFYSYVVAEAFIVPVVLLCTIALLLWLRRYRLLFLLIAVTGLLFTIVVLAFEDWFINLYDHYYEHMLQPAIFFIVLILCYALATIPRQSYTKAGFAAIVLVISFSKIVRGREPHEVRQRWMSRCLALMDKQHIKKAVAGRQWVPHDLRQGSFWSAGWESLVMSSLQGPAGSRTLFLAWDINHVREPVQATREVVTDGSSYPQSTLPPRYFMLDDKPYVFLEYIVPDSVLENLRRP